MSQYAIIQSGGRQYRISIGDVLRMEKLNAETGETVSFDRVLAISGEDGEMRFGRPVLDDSVVSGEVVSHGRDPKLRIIKFKRRKNYRRQYGHRQSFTEVRITDIADRHERAATDASPAADGAVEPTAAAAPSVPEVTAPEPVSDATGAKAATDE